MRYGDGRSFRGPCRGLHGAGVELWLSQEFGDPVKGHTGCCQGVDDGGNVVHRHTEQVKERQRGKGHGCCEGVPQQRVGAQTDQGHHNRTLHCTYIMCIDLLWRSIAWKATAALSECPSSEQMPS